MARRFWKIAERSAAVILFVFLVVPFFIEKDLAKSFYSTRPTLCIGSFVAFALLPAAVMVHRRVEERRNKQGEARALVSDGTSER
jgi:hypothetical protein